MCVVHDKRNWLQGTDTLHLNLVIMKHDPQRLKVVRKVHLVSSVPALLSFGPSIGKKNRKRNNSKRKRRRDKGSDGCLVRQ